MKRLIAIALLVASSRACAGTAPANGFYLASGPAPAMIETQDEHGMPLGPLQQLKIESGNLLSWDNANTRFFLGLSIPPQEGLGPSSYVLVVDGTAYRQYGSGGSGGKTTSICFWVSGENNAKQVSKYLHTPVVERQHPGHRLLVSFTPTKHEFSAGEEVTVVFHIKNVGTSTVCFMDDVHYIGRRKGQYTFSASFSGMPVQDIGMNVPFGFISQLSGAHLLKPGETFEDEVNLSRWFSFDKTGTYYIHGAYRLDMKDANSLSPPTVENLEAMALRTIWEDYASADFAVDIKAVSDHRAGR